MTKRTLSIIIIIGVVLGLSALFVIRSKAITRSKTTRQAVFMTDGKVYFGHLTGANQSIATLTGVYYLKENIPLQAGETNDNKTINIIKLGNELHGPEDTMYINHDQILYYETMRSDSKISQAIDKFASTGGK